MKLIDKFVALTLKTSSVMALLAGAVSCEDTGNVEVETPAPRLISIVPGTGYVGCTAIISGEYFSEIPEENIVTVDGTEVPVETAARNRLTLTMPQHELGDVKVAVTVNGQKAPTVLDFTYAELPEFVVNVAGINPQSGYAGDEIVITGENFDLNISEISDRLGFSSPKHFRKCFKEKFQQTPQDFRKGMSESHEEEDNRDNA